MNPTISGREAKVQTVLDQIGALDEAISKISGWFNFHKFQSGSLMISGTNARLKEDHSLLHWGTKIPFPIELMKRFFEDYSQDLISQRLRLVQELDLLTGPPADPPGIQEDPPRTSPPLPGSLHRRQCNDCGQVTNQKFGFYDADGTGQKVAAGYECLTCKTVQL